MAVGFSETVLITWPGYDPGDEIVNTVLTNAGLVARWAPIRELRLPKDVAPLAAGAVGAVVSTDPFDAFVFRQAPGLRVIARTGVGTDAIDLDAATAAGVVVTTLPNINTETVADHTLAMILALTRRIVQNDASVRMGEWNRAGDLTPGDLHGKTVGIVGFGRTGRAVARRLTGFGVRLIAFDVAPHAELGLSIEFLDLDAVLQQADVVTLHVPLLPETVHVISDREFELMPKGALLVNASRGGVVDEASLIRVLRSGHLAGAAIDVYEREPPSSSDLLHFVNVVLSPHTAGISHDRLHDITLAAVTDAISVLRGERPAGVVNPEAYDHSKHRDDSG